MLQRPKPKYLAGGKEIERTSLKSTSKCVSLSSPPFRQATIQTGKVAANDHAAGLLLQRVPQSVDADDDDFNRTAHFAATVTADELFALSAPTLLRRLFPEDDVRLFSGRALQFRCSCTPDRITRFASSIT
jgi:redox-regulated HSP33 family molecular chaperone